jgi:anhydro-N-acetylmuramic acid kinase
MKHSRPEKKMFVALGLMSGTSMDGIDIALVRTNGKRKVERGSFQSFPYSAKFRDRLSDGLRAAKDIEKRGDRPDGLRALEKEVTRRHVAAVFKYLKRSGLRLSDIDIIGFHGQTVLHRPERALTVQLGLGQMLADQTGLPVIHDLRANDMAHGGQGAPLACAYHRALAASLNADGPRWPVAFVNIGGISNVTWIPADGEMIAFDAGPGNMLIDQWMQKKAGKPFDDGGRTAMDGKVVDEIVDSYLENAYFDQSPPKSLDRGDFAPLKAGRASLADGARSLARLSALALVRGMAKLPQPPALWVICGGGSRNAVIMRDIRDLVADSNGAATTQVGSAEDFGLNSEAIEAEAWAYLAVRSLRGLNITWHGTTGVREAATGGRLSMPDQRDSIVSA